MATMAEISSAITQINLKKQTLHQSFLRLQSHLPSSFNLPFNWSAIDSHFTSLKSSLNSKFNLLQTLSPPSRPELQSFCRNSDGLGLAHFIAHSSDHKTILSELPDAYRYSPDAPGMVLDAMVQFYNFGCNKEYKDEDKDENLVAFRSGCLIMLKGLIRLKAGMSVEVKEKAMEMAVEWNLNRICSTPCDQKALGFVLLVGAYGLIDRFNVDDVVECFLKVATYEDTIDLCRRIVPDYINDMIQKLIDKRMIVTAVKFSIELKKTDEFPPGPLLEELKLRSFGLMEERRRNANNLDVWTAETSIGICELKSIIKFIEENGLESEYPKDSVVELVNKLENEMNQQLLSESKRSKKSKERRLNKVQTTKSAAVMKSESNMSKKSKWRKLNNVKPTAESAAMAPVQSDKSIQESHSRKSGLSPDHVAECQKSPNGSSAPYASTIGSSHVSTGASTGYDFYVPQLQPHVDCNSNGWISD